MDVHYTKESRPTPDVPLGANGTNLPDGPALRKLQGASPVVYAKREISEAATLLGNRYLCRGNGMFIVAPSGHGKSVLAVQCAILWSAGLPAFGIRPPRPLRCLMIQAEDDEGDLIEMSRMIDHLGLTEEQKALVERNCHFEFVNDLTGKAFVDCLEGFLKERPFDLVFINPYTAYLGADIKDSEANTRFLRNWLNPVLTRQQVAIVIIHHTPKTNFRDTSDWKPSDWMYAGDGDAGLTNWARAYLVIDPTETQGVYRFIASKRHQRLGWPEREQHWAHSGEEGKLLWVPATADQIALAKKAAKTKPEDLLRLVPELDPILQEKLFQKASEHGFGQKKTRDFLKILEADRKVFRHKIRRAGAKSAVGYAKTTPPED
jgi:hypothetical protein